MTDPERIYLEPGEGSDRDGGRMWCEHDVWDGMDGYEDLPPATAYVRADSREEQPTAAVLGLLNRAANFANGMTAFDNPWFAKEAWTIVQGLRAELIGDAGDQWPLATAHEPEEETDE